MTRPNYGVSRWASRKAAMSSYPAALLQANVWRWPASYWCSRAAKCTLMQVPPAVLRVRRVMANRVVRKEVVRESLGTLYTTSGNDRGPYGLDHSIWHARVSSPACQRPAGGGLPRDSGASELPRRDARYHGKQRCDAT